MVLELIFNPFALKKKPIHIFISGFFYTILAAFLAYFSFRDLSGILTVFLIVISTLPLVYNIIKREEELDLRYSKELFLLKEHSKVLIYFLALFLGILFAFTLLYLLLPENMTNALFSYQQSAIAGVNNNLQGAVIGGVEGKGSLFVGILLNNFKVLFFCILFSFMYGSGAIFILTWNASVIATAMGALIKNQLAISFGSPGLYAYFTLGVASFFRYMTHGIVEIAAYFIAGLAGGIISIALIKHDLKEKRVLIDALDLIFVSVGVLILAGVIEVYITPVLFG